LSEHFDRGPQSIHLGTEHSPDQLVGVLDRNADDGLLALKPILDRREDLNTAAHESAP
jgi:hypothetical protein